MCMLGGLWVVMGLLVLSCVLGMLWMSQELGFPCHHQEPIPLAGPPVLLWAPCAPVHKALSWSQQEPVCYPSSLLWPSACGLSHPMSAEA